jgi:uncharacterized Fe-S cluster-containing protein
MKKALTVVLEDKDIIELMRILMDSDAEGALEFLCVNCGQCNEATCLAFAVALIQHKRSLAECPPLQSDSSLADRKATLEAML